MRKLLLQRVPMIKKKLKVSSETGSNVRSGNHICCTREFNCTWSNNRKLCLLPHYHGVLYAVTDGPEVRHCNGVDGGSGRGSTLVVGEEGGG